ncbi:VanZ family protein [Agromyces sp. MMS24-JH15]|uniref:VanZ family protein n=1 Tax=Agromyces sp. MMS24-JH15 TaxID=3243765 RepID=UPI00374855EA
MTRRAVLALATAAYLAVVAWATLGTVSWHPIGWEAEYGVLTPSIWVDPDTWAIGSPREFVANVAMFVPLAALFALLLGPRRWLGALTAAIGVSVAIELVQIPLDDRISDPRDLLANSIGAAIGVAAVGIGWIVLAIARTASRLFRRSAGPANDPGAGGGAVADAAPKTAPTRPELSRTGR